MLLLMLMLIWPPFGRIQSFWLSSLVMLSLSAFLLTFFCPFCVVIFHGLISIFLTTCWLFIPSHRRLQRHLLSTSLQRQSVHNHCWRWHCFCCWFWLNWITRNFYIFSPCLGRNIRELGSGGTACSWSSCACSVASWCLCFTFGVSKLRFKENLKYCCPSEELLIKFILHLSMYTWSCLLLTLFY